MSIAINDLFVSEAMKQSIVAFLDTIEEQYDVRILYACESGSRAWGFASPDSDYDIRFIYAPKEVDYLCVDPPVDHIEIPIENDLDAGGWDVRKSLSLLRKTNGALLEWLHSPIVYYQASGFLSQWREAGEAVRSERSLVDHYRGLAMQMWKGPLLGTTVRAKSYLYCLRAVLAAQWVIQKRCQPPVPFDQLLQLVEPSLRAEVDSLLAAKAVTGEKEKMERLPGLDHYLGQALSSSVPEELTQRRRAPKVMNALFKRWVGRAADVSSVSRINLGRVTQKDLLLFRSIAGSQAYGTHHDGSDTDYRGVFALPARLLGGLDSLEQVQDERGDDVFFELGKVVKMLLKNNPNMMELLYMPEDCVLHRHPAWELLKPEIFLSKRCELSFANYAIGQVKKARGLNKKIVNPEPKKRKGLIDFCYVMVGQGSLPLQSWLEEKGLDEKMLGLVNCVHAPHVYGLYVGNEYRGIFSAKSKDELICSSVTIDASPEAWMVCNVDAYKKHCKDHKEYWDWVRNRNPQRYNKSNEIGYDTKNMMHTLRLLDVAEEIAQEGKIIVRRPNREYLMKILAGEFSYEYLLSVAEEKGLSVQQAYASSSLPEEPCTAKVSEVLMEMREELR